MVSRFRGATLVFEHTNCTENALSLLGAFMYTAAAIANCDASENPCISTLEVSEQTMPSHLGIERGSSCSNCCRNADHLFCNSVGKGSSHPVFNSHRSCKIVLALISIGEINPKGSYSFAMSEAIALLVKVTVPGIVEEKCRVSEQGRQTRPRILHRVGSISTSVGLPSFDLGRSSGQLLLHFCNGNPPASQSRVNCCIISLASDGESAPPKMSSTYLPFVIGMTALG